MEETRYTGGPPRKRKRHHTTRNKERRTAYAAHKEEAEMQSKRHIHDTPGSSIPPTNTQPTMPERVQTNEETEIQNNETIQDTQEASIRPPTTQLTPERAQTRGDPDQPSSSPRQRPEIYNRKTQRNQSEDNGNRNSETERISKRRNQKYAHNNQIRLRSFLRNKDLFNIEEYSLESASYRGENEEADNGRTSEKEPEETEREIIRKIHNYKMQDPPEPKNGPWPTENTGRPKQTRQDSRVHTPQLPSYQQTEVHRTIQKTHRNQKRHKHAHTQSLTQTNQKTEHPRNN